ncbi:MAG TPA: SDR family NAD(P)-dependent oxidoreductase, partial [SAR324 cluster bacterium]|nr:SDR family NAD(P)-dependent oxidoreductase [SAR324 cluster bacterium]
MRVHRMGGFAYYPSLEDRSVFITGGASGIGESLVEAFVRQKSRVAFIDLDFDASQALQKRLEDEGLQKPWFKPCDVRDIASLEKCLRNAALDLGPVSVLVNNAGNDERHKADEISVEYWDDRIAVNLR